MGVNFTKEFLEEWEKISDSIKFQMASRGVRAANELRNASQIILRGGRGGRRYNVPGTGRVKYKKGKRIVVGREADNYGRKGRKIYGREAGTATITYKKYTASAPGEPPAVRTGAFRASWQPKSVIESNGGYSVVSSVESTIRTDNGKYLLGELLEDGTGKMAPRPHHEKIQQKALPKITGIYNEPYL